MAADNEAGLKGPEKIIAEAKRRALTCIDWERNPRKLFVDDLKFDAADSDNRYQWPQAILNVRGDERPALTINKTQQHNKQIINDGKQNTPSIKISPTGDGASADSAQVFADVVRRIEYISNARSAYNTAYAFAVRGGIGYFRIVTDYVHDDTFDQDLFIRRVKDPLSIYLDPDINEEDGSDARFGFVFEDRPNEEVIAEYPHLKDKITAQNAISGSDSTWITRDHTRIAEYYRKVSIKDKLILLTEPETLADGTPNELAGQVTIRKASEVPKEILALAVTPETKYREISREVVEWFKIVGDEIVDERCVKNDDALPIPYIPIIRVIGEETIIEGKLDRKGHTRHLKDPQRMFNYNASAAVEFGALQSKTPYIAPIRAIEGLETYWNNANRTNPSVLGYNDIDDQGKPIQAPQRQQPPTGAPVFLQGMQDAQQQMMMVSGQYQAQTGEEENARSGKAINARQRQGDNATYHYIDNLAMAIRLAGKILVSWIPHVYDTERVLKIRAEDGTEREIKVDPNAEKALIEKKNQQREIVESIFNPKVGKYDVQADVGPGYATKRQEAFNAFSQIATGNPQAMDVMGDFVFRVMDTPFSEEIAERWKRKIPKDILGEGPTPEMVALKTELENVKGILTDVVTQLAEKDMELKGVRAAKDVDAYKAETERAVQTAKLVPAIAPEVLVPLVTQAVAQALSQHWPPDSQSPRPVPMDVGGEGGDDLPPLSDLPIDQRPQVDALLSDGQP